MKSKKTESILDNLYLASPCSISWESMIGDERERSCGGCSRTIYNISDMPRKEAEAFLARVGTNECVKFYRRKDGTIMTDDCPRAFRKLRDGAKWAARAAAALVAFLVAAPTAFAQGQQIPPYKMGKVRYGYGSPNGGGLMPMRPGQVIIQETPVITNVQPANVSTTIEATIITKQHTLPDGRKVTLVIPNPDGNIIMIQPSKPVPLESKENKFIDTRAADFYKKGENARNEKNFALSEFYFEKALDVFNQQANGDPQFRKLIEQQLKQLESERTSGIKEYSDNEPKSEQTGIKEYGELAQPSKLEESPRD